jgi:membrane-associated phospholipid phosphatase
MNVEDYKLRNTRRTFLGGYFLVFIWSTNTHGLPVDRLAVLTWILFGFGCAMIGRNRNDISLLTKDWLVLVAIYLFYDYSRGMADQLGMPVHVTELRDLDRLLTGGVDASAWMQERFYEPQSVRWYDIAGSLIYMSHFVLPVIPLVYLRVRHRGQWVRYVRRLGLTFGIAVMCFILYPAAPPWMAAREGYTDTVWRITGRGWGYLNLDTVSKTFDRGVAVLNPVAAMPSLHAGLAMLVTLWVTQNSSRLVRILAMSFPISMLLTLVYFGEHYIVDALAGWLTVWAAWKLADKWEAREALRTPRRQPESVLQ